MDSVIATAPLRWMRGSFIGAGSFGKVHLALNLDSGEMFTVKSIRGKADELEKEIRILQSLQESPNIVRCMGSLDFEGSKMMCMEYMPGGTLTDFMNRFGGKLEESLVRVYCRRILQGMEFFHRKGIVHCDIKASNVLVGSKGEVKIADFGCAKTIAISAEEEEKEMSVKGSPMWMAPEVIREEEQGPASDVWSLGCTLLELLTGRPPWTSSSSSTSNPMHALFTIASSSSSSSQLLQHYYYSSSSSHHSFELSEEGKDFLLCCLQMDPKARWTASQLLMHPFLVNATQFSYKEKELLTPPSSPISTLDFHAQYWKNSHTSTSSSSSSKLIPPPQSSSLATPSDHSIHITTRDDDLIRQHRFILDDAQDTITTTTSSSSSSQNSSHTRNRIQSLQAEEDEDSSSSCRSSSSGVIIDDNQQWIVVHESPSSCPGSSSSPSLKPFSDFMCPSSSSPSLCLQQQEEEEEEEEGRRGGQALVVKKACNVDLDCFGFLINRRPRQG